MIIILMNNSSRGVMKLSAENLDTYEGITERVQGTDGVPYETIEHLSGVDQLDRLDDSQAVILVRSTSGALDLRTIPLP